jgi:hypothetical protein
MLPSADSSVVHGEASSSTVFVSMDGMDSMDSAFRIFQSCSSSCRQSCRQRDPPSADRSAVHGETPSTTVSSPWTVRTALWKELTISIPASPAWGRDCCPSRGTLNYEFVFMDSLDGSDSTSEIAHNFDSALPPSLALKKLIIRCDLICDDVCD